MRHWNIIYQILSSGLGSSEAKSVPGHLGVEWSDIHVPDVDVDEDNQIRK